MKGMRIRVLPSEVQARTFELLGAVPLRWDLTEAIAAIKAGTIDAQENPFANTVTYHVHKFHNFHTVTNHFYISRPIFLHRTAFDAWPQDLRDAMRDAVAASVAFQRELAIEEDASARQALADQGCEITELTADEHAQFKRAVEPLWTDARKQFGREMFELMPASSAPVGMPSPPMAWLIALYSISRAVHRRAVGRRSDPQPGFPDAGWTMWSATRCARGWKAHDRLRAIRIRLSRPPIECAMM